MQAVFFLAFITMQLSAQSTSAADSNLANDSHHARELMAEHRFAEAVPIYESLVRAVPGNTGLLLNLALAEEMAGRPARAGPRFEAVLKIQPDSVPALVSLSMARLQLNQPKEAIAPLKKVIALDPGDRNALGMLADAEMSLQQFGEAATYYRRLSANDTTDPRAWYGLGKAYESLATATFDRLNKSAPESAYVAFLLAETRLQRRQYRSAFFFFRTAQAKLPDLPGIHAGLALVYRNTDHPEWADDEQKREATLPRRDCAAQPCECAFLSQHFLEASQGATAPGASASALFWATKAYNQLAVEAFDHLNQMPESVQIHAFKAQMLRDRKQNLEAANEWRAALKLAPEDRGLKRELALSLFDASDYQASMQLVQELLAEQPQSPELNYLLGASLFRTEQAERALPYLQLGVRGHSDVLPAEAALGLTLVSLSKNAEAIPHLKKALALDDDGSLHYSLARAYRAAGEMQLASQSMQQYQAIQKQNEEINDQLAKEAEITAPLH